LLYINFYFIVNRYGTLQHCTTLCPREGEKFGQGVLRGRGAVPSKSINQVATGWGHEATWSMVDWLCQSTLRVIYMEHSEEKAERHHGKTEYME